MATLDDSPSVYSGQSWSIWAEKVPSGEEDDPDEDDPSKIRKDDNNSMKLRKEDMPLFGYCPAQDELYLVVCEKCGQVIKPQALKAHLEKRHGSKDASHHHSSARSQSSTSRGSNCGGLGSHRTSSHLHSAKSGCKQSANTSHLKVTGLADTMKSVEVSLERISADVKTVSLNSESVKSQHSPKTCNANNTSNLTANSVSNGMVKSAANGTEMTSFDSSPSPTAPPGGGLFGAHQKDSLSPMHNTPRKTSTSSPHLNLTTKAPQSSGKHSGIAGRVPSSPSSSCSSPVEGHTDTRHEDNHPMKSPVAVPASSKSPSAGSAKKSSLSVNPSDKSSKTLQNFTKALSSTSSSKSSSSSLRTSGSPSKCVTSPAKSSTSPARSAASPAKSATSPARSLSSPVKSAPSPAKSPSKSSANPALCPNSSTPKPPQEKKLCRDREFDPNKHCGVLRADDGRQCTRSLTCKTHALSLRRAVEGRRKNFDDLLKEHRAAKEAQLKAKSEGKAVPRHQGPSPAASPGPQTPEGLRMSPMWEGGSLNKEDPFAAAAPHTHKLSQPHANAAPKPHKLSQKSFNSHHSRMSSSGLGSPTWSLKEEMSPPEVFSRLSSDGEPDTEEYPDRGDNPYISHHPRPIATCSFGARCSSGGWYLLSRKTDYLRTAFLSALEKHLHPPPHKKLCVESKLPKEPQLLTNSMDPYEFNIGDMSGGASSSSANPAANTAGKPQLIRQKSKPSGSRTSKSKGDNSGSPRLCQPGSNSTSPTGGQGGATKRKRSSSGASGGASPGASVANATNVSLHNAMIGNLSLASPNSGPIIATCIPNVNVNLSSNTLSRFNATLATTKAPNQLSRNSIIKDGAGGFNLLVTTNMDQGGLMNGQYVNISTGLQVDDKTAGSSKRSRSGGTSKHNSNRQSTGVADGLCAVPNNIMANLTPKTFLLDKTMLASGAVSSFQAGSVVSLASSNMSPPQASPTATASPLYRSGSVSPQVSAASPIPNGVISPSGIGLKAYPVSALNHLTGSKVGSGHVTSSKVGSAVHVGGNKPGSSSPASRTSTPSPSPVFSPQPSPNQHAHSALIAGKAPSGSGSHKSHGSKSAGSHRTSTGQATALRISAGHQATNIHPKHANSIHNFCVTNANIGSLPLKAQSVNISKPVPLTFPIPFTVASSASHSIHVSSQPQPTATLFVTSDSLSKAEIQLQQASSTHPNVIS